MKPLALSVLSGGLDSTTATVLAQETHHLARALTFDYGQRAAAREIATSRRLCQQLGIAHDVMALPWISSLCQTRLIARHLPLPQFTPDELGMSAAREAESAQAVWVPNRNGLFLAIAASVAESCGTTHLIVGFNVEEASTFPDNSAAFVNAYNTSLTYSTKNSVRVISPTLSMNKKEIMRAAFEHDINPSTIWCCYEGEEKMCGRCESCARTIRAAQANGVWEAWKPHFAIT